MRGLLLKLVPAVSAVAALLLALPRSFTNSVDEAAWRDLVQITDDSSCTPAGQTAAGWRFWTTRKGLFPAPGQPAPTASSFGAYRDLAFQAKQTLPASIEQLAVAHSMALSLKNLPGPGPKEVIFLNPVYADFVLKNGLYRREGMIDHVYMRHKGTFQLPDGAAALKTEWLRFDESKDCDSDYVIGREGSTRYKLVAFHLLDLKSHKPFASLWATWIHQDFLGNLNGFPITDDFGWKACRFPSNRLIDLVTGHSQRFWLKYRLIGSQVDVRHRMALGNPLIEGRIEPDLNKFSCLACHRQAAISQNGVPFGPTSSNTGPTPGVLAVLPWPVAETDFSFTLALAPKCQKVEASCTGASQQ